MVKTRSASRLVTHDSSIVGLRMGARVASGDHSHDEAWDHANQSDPSRAQSVRKRLRKSTVKHTL
jgi:hypothetical protein